MHLNNMQRWMHSHRFGGADLRAERRTRWVAYVTAVTMIAEIVVGWLSGSMALLADGWHMGTHMFALGIAAFAYYFARKHGDNPSFAFGTGKVGSLAGFTSAILLGIIAVGVVGESVCRLLTPRPIQFTQAITVAFIGLIVNLVCAMLLYDAGSSEHRGEHHHDHNLKAAFGHVLADALTSVLALVALVAVRFWSLGWMDPVVALVGAGLIAVWAVGLLRDTGGTLLDAAVAEAVIARIRVCLESDADSRIADLHVWRVGGNALSVALSIVTHHPRPSEYYRALLKPIPQIAHSTIEVIVVSDTPCLPAEAEQSKAIPRC
jgi:cation diffusion facilitator family transporter